MRQAGILAAAGLIALEQMPDRLHEDHANARFLAGALAAIPGGTLDPAAVQTNILICDIAATGLTPELFSDLLRDRGVLANGATPTAMRMVTHYDVSRSDCERAAELTREILTAHRSTLI
jgi:threonine aldolase